MNLNFSCRCDDDLDPDQSTEVVQEFLDRVTQVDGCGVIETEPGEAGGSDRDDANQGAFAFGFQLTPECGGTLEGQVLVLDQIMVVLADLSRQHELQLSLGHQMEPMLGRIIQGNAEAGLIDELQTSIRVAVSLAEMTLESSSEEEDELVELEQELPEESQEEWSNLLGDGETFQRFPPWERVIRRIG